MGDSIVWPTPHAHSKSRTSQLIADAGTHESELKEERRGKREHAPTLNHGVTYHDSDGSDNPPISRNIAAHGYWFGRQDECSVVLGQCKRRRRIICSNVCTFRNKSPAGERECVYADDARHSRSHTHQLAHDT